MPSEENNTILSEEDILNLLKYQIDIEYTLPSKKHCPFSCKKHYKKE